MATPKFSSKSPTIRRILREAAEISNSPSADYTAEPLESDLFEWHFTLRGPPNSVYSNGIYHGRIVLPPTYPLRPPSFRFMTPSGRFEANREICLSISGHHEETWQPAWGVRTALVALRSFMETDARGQLGGLETTDAVRQRLANESSTFKCSSCGKTNGEIIQECEERAKEASSSAQEVEVPKELNMGWRDEMGTKKEGETKTEETNDDAETAQLAEGFVQTAPDAGPGPADNSPPAPQPQFDNRNPTPTRTIPLPVPAPAVQAPVPAPIPAQAQHQPARRASDDGVPLWLDRAIVVLVVLLVALVLKIIFAV
ncbi:ubiquitin-conjugating enzyme/RWD-like protein [Fusarium flagelliforme]|uniref:Ubiquitin-conjugating enzyme e2 j1 n=1 Tax=Fusarium flagelliforme TaxID=2675880 RepID=A0A395N393_9HYPO|nr:ubiquitin-conjugating enzyme/RWD-like protein [Fusarium flagelliforme]KAH7189180.1 ubiquitin-conjugating enzyme/RWD-like protein [Fusarium flagelliforme]RFN54604.1 ubiquitin-conjugating enzyme e2 j1 [Fusarium flagelliforme]